MKAQTLIIDAGIFPFEVMIHIGPFWQLQEQLKAKVSSADYDQLLNQFDGKFSARTLMSEHMGVTVIWFKTDFRKNTPEFHSIVAHELYHAVELILDRVGVPKSNDTSEVYAYLLQHFTKQFYMSSP